MNRRCFTRRRSDVRALEVLDSITDGIYALDREWRYTYINERALLRVRKAKGDELTRKDLLGRNLWEIFPEQVDSVFYRKFHEALREQKTLEFEARITLPDTWIDVRVYPSEEGVSVYYRDITERKRARETLERSQAYLAETQRVSRTGSWAWNVSTGECAWSLEHFRIFGLDPETFKPTKENTQRLIHPEDLPRVEQNLATAIREHSEFDVDYRLVRPDGSIRYHHGLGRPVTNESGELELIGTVVDVTEARRAAEELHRSESYLAEAERLSHTGSWAWNVSTGTLFWSAEHFRICGVDPKTFNLTAEAAQKLIHPDDRDAADQAFYGAIQDRTDFERNLRISRPDGTIRYVHSLAHPVFNESAELTDYVGTIIDLTDRKRAEEERELLLRRAITAHEEERRRISREIHDELGQHVSALGLKLTALKRDCTNQTEIRGEIESIEKVLHKLDSDLDLLVWNLRPAALDTVGFRNALSNLVEHLPKHAGIHAELQTVGLEDASLPPEVEVVLYRVVQEALTNVAKHALARNVYVVVERRAGQVSLIIEDDGKGVNYAWVIEDGQGVGLIGIRERAATLGGTFEFESHPGRGTTVAVRIPLPDVST